MFRAAAKRPRPSVRIAADSLCATAMFCLPSASIPAAAAAAVHGRRPQQPATDDLARQHLAAALAAVMQAQPRLRAATSADFGGSSSASRYRHEQRRSQHQQRRSYRRNSHQQQSTAATALSECAPSRGSDSVHQTGTGYRSNNAGDGPEKTRDRKSWFPRFKSNWLGTYRSKQMFHCCECAVADAPGARYKGSEGKHCACGQDQWHLAKTIEEAEYNRRMEISKALGGLRYDEALERLKAMGTSEIDLKRLRCESDEASVASSCSSVDDHADAESAMHASKRIKNEPGLERSAPLPSPATRAYGGGLQRKLSASSSFGLEPVPTTGSSGATLTAELLQKINSHHAYNSGLYTPLSSDYLGDHLMPAPFADEEGFGELLQGFLEDDPRSNYSTQYPQAALQQQQQQSARLPSASSSTRSAAPPYGGYSTPFLAGSSPNDHHHGDHQQQPPPPPPHHHQQQLPHQRYPQAPSTLPPPPQGDVDFEFFADGHPRAMMAPAQQAAGYYPPTHLHPHHSHHHHHHAQSQYARPHHVAVAASPPSYSIV